MRQIVNIMLLMCLVICSNAVEGGQVVAGNLIYAKSKTSKCFSASFLKEVSKMTAIKTKSTFSKVKLADSDALKNYPFVIMNGEGSFKMTQPERKNLKKYFYGFRSPDVDLVWGRLKYEKVSLLTGLHA